MNSKVSETKFYSEALMDKSLNMNNMQLKRFSNPNVIRRQLAIKYLWKLDEYFPKLTQKPKNAKKKSNV